jgi:chromosome segregation ATPase
MILKLNSEMRGGQIAIFPLELSDQMRTSKENLPPKSQALPIQDVIELSETADKRVAKLLDNYLGRVMMVKDLSSAFELAESHSIMCITSHLKIVNPGSFIAKAG